MGLRKGSLRDDDGDGSLGSNSILFRSLINS